MNTGSRLRALKNTRMRGVSSAPSVCSITTAIRAATAVAARCLGVERRTGTLVPGMEADLIVVERNPLDDIRALQDVLVVLADGNVAFNRIPFGLGR